MSTEVSQEAITAAEAWWAEHKHDAAPANYIKTAFTYYLDLVMKVEALEARVASLTTA